MRGVDKETQEWHALKFLSRNAYDPQREIDTWQTLKHLNIVSLLRAFAPVGTRPHWVLAMPEADFTLHEYMRRSLGGQARATEDVVTDLAGQLLAGIACVHEHGLVHVAIYARAASSSRLSARAIPRRCPLSRRCNIGRR